MSLGLVGRKVGMTRIFTDDGAAVPVTVLDVANNRVTQIKTPETDGYAAVQVTFGKRRASRVTKPQAGPPRQGRGGSRRGAAGIPRRRRRARQVQGGRRGRRGHVRGRPDRRRHGHDERQGLLRRDQAPQLQLEPRVARQLALAQHAGLDLDGAGSGSRVSGQAHGRPARQRDAHDADPQGRARRRRARAAAGQGLRARAPKAATWSSCRRRRRRRRRERRRWNSSSYRRQGPDDRDGRRARRAVRPRLQRGAGAPGRRRLPGQRAPGHARAEGPQRDQQVAQEAVGQKGTGRARAGQATSPLWRGGGRIFPNSPDENFSHKVNRKMYRAGMASILSQLVREDRLAVVERSRSTRRRPRCSRRRSRRWACPAPCW